MPDYIPNKAFRTALLQTAFKQHHLVQWSLETWPGPLYGSAPRDEPDAHKHTPAETHTNPNTHTHTHTHTHTLSHTHVLYVHIITFSLFGSSRIKQLNRLQTVLYHATSMSLVS